MQQLSRRAPPHTEGGVGGFGVIIQLFHSLTMKALQISITGQEIIIAVQWYTSRNSPGSLETWVLKMFHCHGFLFPISIPRSCMTSKPSKFRRWCLHVDSYWGLFMNCLLHNTSAGAWRCHSNGSQLASWRICSRRDIWKTKSKVL